MSIYTIIKKQILILFFAFISFCDFSQLIISNQGATAATVVSGFIGSGLTITNPVLNCPTNAYGTFSGGTGIGVTNGVVLTTGLAANISNPASSFMSTNNGTSCNDPQLVNLDALATNDCCILEFDVVPQCNQLSVRFVFGSEEYPTFVNSSYNDAFGFFVTGPNPSGGVYTNKNIAVVTGTTICSIDNVNANTNSGFYVNNSGGTSLTFGGYTTAITSVLSVTPCQTYHFKMAIADAGDHIYDSGVLIDFLQCSNSLSVSSTSVDASCGMNNGTASAVATGGLGVLSYSWSPAPGGGQGTPNVTGLTSGVTYTVTVSDNFGCIDPKVSSVLIGGTVTPVASISGSASVCNGGNTDILFTGTPNATVTYTVNSGVNQTIVLDGTGSATVNTGALSANASYDLVNVSLGGCLQTQSGNVTVTILSLPTVNIIGTTSVCNGGNADISFTGTANATVTYTINSGVTQTVVLDGSGNATVNTGAISSNVSYNLVDVTLGSCSQTLIGDATVTISLPPTASISGSTTICSGETAIISFTGTANATVSYTVNGGAAQIAVLDGLGEVTISTPALTSNQTYQLISCYFASNQTCLSNLAESELVTVLPLPTATISGTTTICSGNTATISFTGVANAIVTYTINGGANQTVELNGAGFASVTTAALSVNTTYDLVSIATSGIPSCTSVLTGSAVVTVDSSPTATISGSATICSGGTAVISFTGTANATVTYTVDGGVNQTIVLDGAGVSNLTTPTLSANSTYALVSVASSGTPSCSLAITESVTISMGPPPTATSSGTTSVCSGSTASIVFNGNANSTVSYTVNGGTAQTILLNGSGTASVTTSALNINQTYQLVSCYFASNPSCETLLTESELITILPLPTATISGTTTICSGSTATILFTGTPNATVTYTINGGVNQTVVLDGLGNASVTTGVLSANATYELVSVMDVGISSCTETLNGSAVITVNPLPTATISGTTTICSGNTAIITFAGSANAIVTYTFNGGSNQTVTLNGSGLATITTAALTANASYALVNVASSGSPTCLSILTGSAVITVNPLPIATISGTTTICSGSTATITFTGTANSIVTYVVNGGANQTVTLNGAGSASVTTAILSANAIYSLVSIATADTPSCTSTIAGSAVVTVNPLPTATISGTTTICSGNTTTIAFTGTANAIVTYTINGGANQTITLNGTGSATVTTAVLSSNATYALVSVATSGTPSCSTTLTGSVLVTVNSVPSATITGGKSICSGASALISFSGTPNSLVTYNINGGASQTLLLDASGLGSVSTGVINANAVYNLISVANSNSPFCSQALNLSTTVIIESVPTISFISDKVAGCTPLTIQFTNNTVNSNNCVWVFGDGSVGNSCTSIVHTYTQPGCYDVTLTANSPNNCTASLIINDMICVEAIPVAAFNPTPDIISVLNSTSTMDNISVGASNYEWSFGDGTNSTEINPEHTFDIGESLNFNVNLIAISTAGCRDTANVLIKVNEELIFYIPNTFTPDGDKFNQIFQPVFTKGYDPYDYNLIIFNRWGEILFESNDTKIGWDGTYGGKIVQDGIYTWKINFKLKSFDDRKELTGHVNILR